MRFAASSTRQSGRPPSHQRKRKFWNLPHDEFVTAVGYGRQWSCRGTQTPPFRSTLSAASTRSTAPDSRGCRRVAFRQRRGPHAEAIDVIRHQGEGSIRTPTAGDPDGELAHFSRFREVYVGSKSVYDEKIGRA